VFIGNFILLLFLIDVIRYYQNQFYKAVTGFGNAKLLWYHHQPEAGPSVTERFSHSACYCNKSIYVFGGMHMFSYRLRNVNKWLFRVWFSDDWHVLNTEKKLCCMCSWRILNLYANSRTDYDIQWSSIVKTSETCIHVSHVPLFRRSLSVITAYKFIVSPIYCRGSLRYRDHYIHYILISTGPLSKLEPNSSVYASQVQIHLLTSLRSCTRSSCENEIIQLFNSQALF
jgi:hypothetical protein